MTNKQKNLIRTYVTNEYKTLNAKEVLISRNGSVSCLVDQFPNCASKGGRMFVGFDTDILKYAE
jgi:hypothetical protein